MESSIWTTVGAISAVLMIILVLYFLDKRRIQTDKKNLNRNQKPSLKILLMILVPLLLFASAIIMINPSAIGWSMIIDDSGIQAITPVSLFERNAYLSWNEVTEIKFHSYGKYGGIRDMYLIGRNQKLTIPISQLSEQNNKYLCNFIFKKFSINPATQRSKLACLEMNFGLDTGIVRLVVK